MQQVRHHKMEYSDLMMALVGSRIFSTHRFLIVQLLITKCITLATSFDILTQDLGWFAAPTASCVPTTLGNAAVALVGNELIKREADGLSRTAVGSSIPLAPRPVAS